MRTVQGERNASPNNTTADVYLHALSAAGVRTAFGLPGVHNLPFWRRLDDFDTHPSGIRVITVRHEQTAAYAADGLARATGGLGVTLVTSGPGAANTLAAFGEASASGVPLLVIASDVPEAQRDRDRNDTGRVKGLLHESPDQGAWFGPLAKAVLQPRNAADAVAAVGDAIDIAMSHPRGPVYLGVPSDVLNAPAATQGRREPSVPAAQEPTTAEVTAAADLLSQSRRPALWVGGGAVASGADIDPLAWRLGAPVFATYAARGLLPSGHPLLVDVPAMEPAARALLSDADLLLVLGSALDGMTTANWTLPRPTRVIDVNVASSGNFDPDLIVAADASAFIEAVTLRVSPREPWADSPFRIRDAARAAAASDERTREAAAFVDAIENAWPRENVVVCDMSVGGYWVGGYAAVHHARHLLYPVGWGTLGYGLPAAIGAAASGTPTLAVVGDGGLAMTLGELATVAQHQLPLTLLVVDDGGYGMLRFDQSRHGDPHRGVDLVTPNWSQVASAFELPVTTVAATEDLRDAVSWAAASGAPRILTYEAALFPPRSTSPRWADPER
ncbi:MAG TPA: thiamine pyrophosphate-binding protein [Actinomycetes bacterium]|nr:thiamine pyrophosphate-binding protein [Actinomycetes bacterium]